MGGHQASLACPLSLPLFSIRGLRMGQAPGGGVSPAHTHLALRLSPVISEPLAGPVPPLCVLCVGMGLGAMLPHHLSLELGVAFPLLCSRGLFTIPFVGRDCRAGTAAFPPLCVLLTYARM
eukprot:RCo029793